MSIRSKSFGLIAALMLVFVAPAVAQIEVGGGYSNLKLAGVDNNLKDANGFGLNLRLSTPIIPVVFNQLRVGIDLGWRQYSTTGSGTNLENPDQSDLNIFAGNGRVAFRQPLGLFFVEPSVEGGFLVGVYSNKNHFNASSFDQTSTGWSIQPGLAAGVHLAIFTAGIEANYRYGRLTFDNGAGGDLKEWYAGVFAGLSF